MSKNAMYMEKYLSYLRSRKYAETTVMLNREILEKFTAFFSEAEENKRRIQDISLRDIEGYFLYMKNHRKVSMTTIAMRIRCLKKYFAFLEKESILFNDPARELKIPVTGKKLPDVPTIEEINQLIQSIDLTALHGMRDKTMIETIYGCGLRLNELISMTTLSIDLHNGIIRIKGKGSKDRIVPVGKKTISHIKKYIRDVRPKLLGHSESLFLWIGRTGRPLSKRTFKNKVTGYLEESGITRSITCHSLRRAFATHMLQNGAHPVHIQHMLGHKSLSTLSKYVRLSITDMRKAHEKSSPGK